MKFFGVIEADKDKQFMLNMPIMGLGVTDDEKYCMGHITGDLNDVTLGHVAIGYRLDFKEWLEELRIKFPKGSFPDTYKITVCSYREACKRALDIYGDSDILEIPTIGGSILEYDLTLMKNKLRKVIESE